MSKNYVAMIHEAEEGRDRLGPYLLNNEDALRPLQIKNANKNKLTIGKHESQFEMERALCALGRKWTCSKYFNGEWGPDAPGALYTYVWDLTPSQTPYV